MSGREEGVGWSKRPRSSDDEEIPLAITGDGVRMGPRPTPEPIRIRCEGTGCPPNMKITSSSGMCSMCGCVWFFTDEAGMVAHDRDDILAMIERGDFG